MTDKKNELAAAMSGNKKKVSSRLSADETRALSNSGFINRDRKRPGRVAGPLKAQMSATMLPEFVDEIRTEAIMREITTGDLLLECWQLYKIKNGLNNE